MGSTPVHAGPGRRFFPFKDGPNDGHQTRRHCVPNKGERNESGHHDDDRVRHPRAPHVYPEPLDVHRISNLSPSVLAVPCPRRLRIEVLAPGQTRRPARGVNTLVGSSIAGVVIAGLFLAGVSFSTVAGADAAVNTATIGAFEKLHRDWVWKRRPRHFDAMWRVPR
jgi:hypothetical protein